MFDEVLPSIRKFGLYATDALIDDILNNPDLGIKLFTEYKQAKERAKQLELETAKQKQIIGELRPKASYYDLIVQNKSLVPITKIAKDYGMSGRAMNKLLHELECSIRWATPGFCTRTMPIKVIPNPRPTPLMPKEVSCIPIGHKKADCSFTTF